MRQSAPRNPPKPRKTAIHRTVGPCCRGRTYASRDSGGADHARGARGVSFRESPLGHGSVQPALVGSGQSPASVLRRRHVLSRVEGTRSIRLAFKVATAKAS